MAMDSVEGASRHFYVAVDRLEFKMDTFVDLLGVTARHKNVPIVVCCSSRDELDVVCSTLSSLSFVSLSCLYSDLSRFDRALILDRFRQCILFDQHEPSSSLLLLVTDACLPLLSSGEPPLSARLLINFHLPTKKETYLRRMTTCLAPDGIMINMVVGGEVVTLKSIEETSNIVIAEMPIKISEIL